jgi:hypothetical protein
MLVSQMQTEVLYQPLFWTIAEPPALSRFHEWLHLVDK